MPSFGGTCLLTCRFRATDFYHGCIYLNQKKFPAGRGYGYVAVSRFQSREGCYLYGKLRRSDFLPVGEEREDEVLERGYLSLSSDDDQGAGLELVCCGGGADMESEAEGEGAGMFGHGLLDFEPLQQVSQE